jgi:uncharacterized protein (TIGR03084 family)
VNEVVRCDAVDGVAWLTIDRPDARNALNKAVRDGLFDGVRRFNKDREARALVLTGGTLMTTTQAAVVAQVAADLAEETTALAGVLSRLPAAAWEKYTPAEGWTIRDQVTHLAFFDDATLLAVTDPAAFAVQRAELLALGDRFPDLVAARYRHLPAQDCLDWYLRSRAALLAAYRAADPGARLPWYGPDMGLASSVTGRLMETWAHGQDILDTIGERREPTTGLRHIADLGVRTHPFCFRLRGRPAPDAPVRVELAGPDGQRWTWGPGDAENRVNGDAMDFCLVVTQRRNVADTGLEISGTVAAEWMAIAQAFAGAATDPRPPGLFPLAGEESGPAGSRP